MKASALLVAAVFILCFAAGLGLLTLRYAQGMAYLSDDPRACIQCHVMQDQFDSWVKSSHHAVATCNGCHVPTGAVMKWVSKADNGFFHSWAFTFRSHPDPIRIKPRNRAIVERRCVDCHQDLADGLLGTHSERGGVSCLHCHKETGHAAFR